MNVSPWLVHLGLETVSSVHDVEPALNVLQRGAGRGKARCAFLQRLFLTANKPEFLIFGLVTAFDILFTTDSRWVHQVLSCTAFDDDAPS